MLALRCYVIIPVGLVLPAEVEMSSKIQTCETENNPDPERFSPLTLSTDLTQPLVRKC